MEKTHATVTMASPDDVIINAPDGNVYLVSKEVYLAQPVLNNGQVNDLLSQGVTLADIPEGSGPVGEGCACYLVNLAGLAPTPSPTKKR